VALPRCTNDREGDGDVDGDVDLFGYALFQQEFTEPGDKVESEEDRVYGIARASVPWRAAIPERVPSRCVATPEVSRAAEAEPAAPGRLWVILGELAKKRLPSNAVPRFDCSTAQLDSGRCAQIVSLPITLDHVRFRLALHHRRRRSSPRQCIAARPRTVPGGAFWTFRFERHASTSPRAGWSRFRACSADLSNSVKTPTVRRLR
jgi:hypothetical protein